jgi:hypothetical protein
MPRVNIYVLDAELWKAFRVGCLQHDTTASGHIVAMIREQIRVWEQEQQPNTAKPSKRVPQARA